MNKLLKLFDRMGNMSIFRAIRRGFVMITPVIMTGAITLVLKSLPIPAYQIFIKTFASGFIDAFLGLLYNATFGVLSLYTATAIGYSVAKEIGDKNLNLLGATLLAPLTFLISVGVLTEWFDTKSLSAVGIFVAIICAVGASMFYIAIRRRLSLVRLFSNGADALFNKSIAAIVPIALVGTFFAMINTLILLATDQHNLWELVASMLNGAFTRIGRNFFGGFAYILLSSVLWFFGIHGSNVLEGVNQGLFYPATQLNADAIAQGLAPTEIYTKTFLDAFVLMGGCGTLLSLLIAFLVFSKNKSNRSLIRFAAVPMIFNINEIMVFGLPIIYNPVMLIPFIGAPIITYLIAVAATKLGFVPMTSVYVEWTTPVLLGGYQATGGSVAGIVLQIINIVVGALIYMPFVRMYDKQRENEVLRNIEQLVDILQTKEAANEQVMLTELEGTLGDVAKLLVNDLEKAIPSDEFFMVYQPQINIDGEIIGAEALLRWKHPVFDMIYPPLVIKLAMEAGLLHELEKSIFLAVKNDMLSFDYETRISVNATAQFFAYDGFIEFIRTAFPEGKMGRSTLCIEITEQSKLITDEQIAKTFAVLKDIGVQLSIDDFSMGYTSLKYLSNNPFDTVKLDGSLIRGLENSRNREIIASIIYLSQSLGFSVIAEFVETEKQRDRLIEIGCHAFQGYLYSRPLTLDLLRDFVKERLQP